MQQYGTSLLATSKFSWDIDPIQFDFPEDVQTYFTHGACPSLAYEIHKLTGWTLAMVSSEPVGSPDYLAHVFAIDSDAMAIDILGKKSLDSIKQEWNFCAYTHRFWGLSEFEYEMQGWFLTPAFDKDSEAKYWAKEIIDILQ